jgi:hypothetical protein
LNLFGELRKRKCLTVRTQRVRMLPMIAVGTLVALIPYNPNSERPFGIVVENTHIFNQVEWINSDQANGGYFDESLEIISPISKKDKQAKESV